MQRVVSQKINIAKFSRTKYFSMVQLQSTVLLNDTNTVAHTYEQYLNRNMASACVMRSSSSYPP